MPCDRRKAGGGIARVRQQCLDRLCTISPNQPFDLRDDLALGRFGAKEIAGARDGEYQDRHYGEQRIKGQSCAFAARAMVDPGVNGPAQDRVHTA